MHMERVECLQQSVVHRHMLHSVDMEVAVGRPERIASSERIGEVDQFKLSILEHLEDTAVIRLLPVIGMCIIFFACMSFVNF